MQLSSKIYTLDIGCQVYFYTLLVNGLMKLIRDLQKLLLFTTQWCKTSMSRRSGTASPSSSSRISSAPRIPGSTAVRCGVTRQIVRTRMTLRRLGVAPTVALLRRLARRRSGVPERRPVLQWNSVPPVVPKPAGSARAARNQRPAAESYQRKRGLVLSDAGLVGWPLLAGSALPAGALIHRSRFIRRSRVGRGGEDSALLVPRGGTHGAPTP